MDAALFKENRSHGYAMIDSGGNLLTAVAKNRERWVTPEIAEILGIKEALSWLKSQQFCPAMVESDRLEAIQAIRR